MDKRRVAEIIGVVYCVIGLLMLLLDKEHWYIFTIIGLIFAFFVGRKTKEVQEKTMDEKINSFIWKVADIVEIVTIIGGVVCIIWMSESVFAVIVSGICVFVITRIFKAVAGNK